MPTHRLTYIDIFRGLAIILVVGAHSFVSVLQLPFIQTTFDNPKYAAWIFNIGAPLFRGHLGVWIFFCISGYTMAMIACKEKEHHSLNLHDPAIFKQFSHHFWQRRLLRIYPLFAVHILFINCIVLASIKATILSLLFLSNFSRTHITSFSPVMWSLVVEVQFYVLFPYIYRFIEQRPKRIMALLITSLPLLFLHHFIFWNPVANPVLFIMANNLPAFIPFFLWGITLFEYRKSILRIANNRVSKSLLLIIVIGVFFLDTGRSLDSACNLTMLVITSALAALSMAVFSNSVHTLRTPFLYIAHGLAFIGRSSYSIYLFHIFPIIMFTRLYPGILSNLLGAVEFLSGMAIGIAAYYWLEKPLLAIRKRLGY